MDRTFSQPKMLLLAAGVTAAMLGAGGAAADDTIPASPRAPAAAATTGKTEVAGKGFEAGAAPDDKEKNKDGAEGKLSLGGLFTSGNSRSLALTGSGSLRYRTGDNQLSLAVAANYARAAKADEPIATTVDNLQGRARYDRFLAPGFAAFLGVSGRRDRFQGLDLRLNVDPGLAYYFIDGKKEQLWGELGYDLQHDVRRDEAIADARLKGTSVAKTETRHNGRAFLGYSNKVSAAVSFDTGVEYIQGLQESKNWRLNWDAGLTSSIGGNFSVATTFSLKYDNNPLPGVRDTDTVTAVSLVYKVQ